MVPSLKRPIKGTKESVLSSISNEVQEGDRKIYDHFGPDSEGSGPNTLARTLGKSKEHMKWIESLPKIQSESFSHLVSKWKGLNTELRNVEQDVGKK